MCLVATDPEGLDVPHPAAKLIPARLSPPPQLGRAFNLVLQTINAFQSFTQAFVVSGGTGGPSDSTLFYTLYLYQRGFGDFDMGYASAMGWVLLLIVAAFTAVNFALSRRWVFYDD